MSNKEQLEARDNGKDVKLEDGTVVLQKTDFADKKQEEIKAEEVAAPTEETKEAVAEQQPTENDSQEETESKAEEYTQDTIGEDKAFDQNPLFSNLPSIDTTIDNADVTEPKIIPFINNDDSTYSNVFNSTQDSGLLYGVSDNNEEQVVVPEGVKKANEMVNNEVLELVKENIALKSKNAQLESENSELKRENSDLRATNQVLVTEKTNMQNSVTQVQSRILDIFGASNLGYVNPPAMNQSINPLPQQGEFGDNQSTGFGKDMAA